LLSIPLKRVCICQILFFGMDSSSLFIVNQI